MKVKKLLASVFASLFAVTSVAALSACDDDEPNPTPDQGDTGNTNNDEVPTDAEIVQAALDALKVESTVSENFTLTTKGNGNVAISWASDNADVISISEGSATVHRAIGEDKTVKLTATAVLNNTTKTKDFTVKVSKIEDQSKTVTSIKALDDKTVTYARGVVSGFVWGGEVGAEVKKAFYITDATGTIYVYDNSQTANMNVGDEVYFSGTKDTYKSVAQLTKITDFSIIGKNKTVDETTVIKDKTITDINSAEAPGGNVYEVTGLVQMNEWGSYSLHDLTNPTNKLGVYFSGSGSKELVNYAPELKDNVGKIVKVNFVVNSTTTDSKTNETYWRGNIFKFVEASTATAEQQALHAECVTTNIVELADRYLETDEIDLPTTLPNFDKASIVWTLVDGSGAAEISEGKLVITPTAQLQSFVLKATITIEGVADPVVITYDSVDACTSFEPNTHAEFISADKGSKLIVQGTVIYGYYKSSGGSYIYIQDDSGYGYYVDFYGLDEFITSANDVSVGGKYAPGTVVQIYGTKDYYSSYKRHEIAPITIQTVSTGTTLPEPTDVEAAINAENIDDYVSAYVTVDQLYYNGSAMVTADGKAIAYYNGFYQNLAVTPETGKFYNIKGIISASSYGKQLYPLSISEVTENIDINFVQVQIKSLFEESYSNDDTVTVPTTLFGNTLSYEVVSGSTTVFYQDGVVTITPTISETSTLKVTPEGNASFNITITTVVKTVEVGTHSATLDFNGSSATYIRKNGEEFDESLVGLDSFYFTVINNGTVKDCALNTGSNGYIRMYNEKADTANGAEMTVSLNSQTGYTLVINSITITYGSSKSAPFIINGTEYTSSTTAFDINASSFTIKNKSTSTSTDNLDIASIVINYTVTVA